MVLLLGGGLFALFVCGSVCWPLEDESDNIVSRD